jgi:predicted TIM-barrel fold metal-dependent hydrolase
VSLEAPDRLLISADAHVQENSDTWARIPKSLRQYAPTLTDLPGGNFSMTIEGRTLNFIEKDPDPEMEFRNDPSGGVDLASRKRDMAREGVDANVVFPNEGLGLGIGDAPAEYRRAHARAYNDWVHEVFSADPKRFKPVGMIPIDDVESAVAKTEHCLKLGFSSVGVAAVVPWRPYFLPYWEPLWSVVEEAELLLNFHIFTGNLAFGADFAWVHHMPHSDFDIAKRACADNEQSFTDYGEQPQACRGESQAPLFSVAGDRCINQRQTHQDQALMVGRVVSQVDEPTTDSLQTATGFGVEGVGKPLPVIQVPAREQSDRRTTARDSPNRDSFPAVLPTLKQ